ncbi:N-acetylmuramic acid 6-phosphate etherase [Plantactinospora sp. BC1]|uniref:N-acetylmuramic acid 6-phosphate etherase n=1 Tax=Plantactinospora sp. BC1 TaxID=2108470 RepID=UPI000D17CF52|nr:N-acetylmuramic acid 6-phosphate etherase [Plantactinospora sp. BC1]AVT31591.1 N-acetylmuramic acid 6-phosphate etherase [Plantactinospora sp. BC1]
MTAGRVEPGAPPAATPRPDSDAGSSYPPVEPGYPADGTGGRDGGAGAVDGRAPEPRAVVRVSSPTELRNPRSLDLDLMSVRDVLKVINEDDRRVPAAVTKVLDEIAVAVELAVTALRAGRRVHYFGAGTSGRLGVLDAAELAPTFNTPDRWFCAHLAGGPDAMWRAVEDAEDDETGGAEEARGCVSPGDLVVGLAASGRTPYVLGALGAATGLGADTVLICADPGAVAARSVTVFIGVETGPEVVTGSTRMKAATAQKLVLNGFSTAVMVRLGRVYSNLMIDMVATNAKLRGRMISILVEATDCTEEVAQHALTEADGDLKAALVSLLSGAAVADARAALDRSANQVRGAIALLAG